MYTGIFTPLVEYLNRFFNSFYNSDFGIYEQMIQVCIPSSGKGKFASVFEKAYDTWFMMPKHERMSATHLSLGKSPVAAKYLLHRRTESSEISKPANLTETCPKTNLSCLPVTEANEVSIISVNHKPTRLGPARLRRSLMVYFSRKILKIGIWNFDTILIPVFNLCYLNRYLW